MYYPKNKIQLVLTIFITLAFLGSGVMKLLGMEQVKMGFEHWGYSLVFMYLIGIFEIAAVIGLWTKRFSYITKTCLIYLMVGAIATHLLFDTVKDAIPAFILLVLIKTLFILEYYKTLTIKESIVCALTGGFVGSHHNKKTQ